LAACTSWLFFLWQTEVAYRNVTSKHLWFHFSWNMRAAFLSTQFNSNTSQWNVSTLQFDSINLKFWVVWDVLHIMHVTNLTVHFIHQKERQKKQGLLLCGYACQLWWNLYTFWSLCTKISFTVVYPDDGDTTVSKTLLLHYLLTTSLSMWSFNIMYQ
jgi:hypothetical protein